MARNVPVRAVLGPRTVPRWPQPGRCFFPFHDFGVTGETGEAMASLGPQTVAPREVRRTVLSLLGVQRTALPNPSVARGHRQTPRYRDIPATIATILGRRTSLTRRDPAQRWTVLERELSSLEAEAATLNVARKAERFALYRRVCELRRRIAFSNPLLDFGGIVFVKRRLAVANHMCDQYYGNFARPGGRARTESAARQRPGRLTGSALGVRRAP